MSTGDELMRKAEGKLKGFMSMFNGSKHEEAQELFQKAAARFKADSEWAKAGDAFMRAGDCAAKGGGYEQCGNYQEAGTCFRKAGDTSRAQTCLDQTIILYIENNRFSNAAKVQTELGDMYEEIHEIDRALENYQKAIKYYNTDDGGRPQAQKVMLKIATVYADREDYKGATKTFEDLAAECLRGNIKSGAREHYFKAALCRVAGLKKENLEEGIAELREAIDSYVVLDNSLRLSRELELLVGIVDSLEQANPDGIREAVQRFSEVKPLDDWKVNLVYKGLSLLTVEDER